MDIRKLVTDSFSDRKKIDKSSSFDTKVADSGKAEKSTSELASDQVSISSSISSDSVDHANRVYNKLNADSLDKVRSIKRQIENGDYDVDAALDKITSRIANDLTALDAVLTNDSYTTDAKKVDTKALLSKLDDSIYRSIAEKLLTDLRGL